MTDAQPDPIQAILDQEAALSDLLKRFNPDPREANINQEAALGQLLKDFFPNTQTPGAPQTSLGTDPIADSFLKLSLENFGSGAAQPVAESNFAFKPVDFSPLSVGLTASTNAKIALAEALYPGVPVFAG